MNSQPTHLMARASIVIEQQPHRLTKTQLVKRIGGKRRRALEAVDRLCSQGYAATTAGPRGWPVYHSLRRYPDEGTDPGTGLPLPAGTDGVPDGNGSAPAPTASPGSGKSGEVRPTANGAGSGAEQPTVFREPRCRICRNPPLCRRTNELLAAGFTTAAIVDLVAPLAATLKVAITNSCVSVHRSRHFPRQMPAADVWRRVLEATAAEQASFDKGMNSLLTAAGYFTTVMLKANMTLTAEETTVSIGDGLVAGRELSKLLAQGDDQQKWAKIHATQARIIEVMRSLPEEYQQMVLAKLDGRPWLPPGGAPMALVKGGTVDDDEEAADPFGDADFDFDDEE